MYGWREQTYRHWNIKQLTSVFNAESHISRMHTDIAHCTGCARSSFCGFHWNLNLALAHLAFVHAKLSSIGSIVFEHGELPGWWRVRQQKVQLWKYHSRSLLNNSNRRMYCHMISISFSLNYTSPASHEIPKFEGGLFWNHNDFISSCWVAQIFV